MIDVYTWPTPNGHKVHIMLEETGLEYKVVPVNIGRGDQFDPEFLKISPNNKMPAIVDHEGPIGRPCSMFESGAILMISATRPAASSRHRGPLSGPMADVPDGPCRADAGAVTPFPQLRARTAALRDRPLLGRGQSPLPVLDKRLGESEYVAGDYSIADMAIMPWLRYPDRQGVDIDGYANVNRWMGAINERPAVRRGLEVLADEVRRDTGFSDEERSILFGARQVAQH